MEKLIGKIPQEIKEIVKACYPDYKGRKYKLGTFEHPMNLDSYWDGGTRYYYAFYDLQTKKVLEVHSNHPFFEAGKPRRLTRLPADTLLVEHCIFCGKDAGVRIYANPENLLKLVGQNNETR